MLMGMETDLFPRTFGKEDSSGLVITVRAESNHLDPILLK